MKVLEERVTRQQEKFIQAKQLRFLSAAPSWVNDSERQVQSPGALLSVVLVSTVSALLNKSVFSDTSGSFMP